MAVELDEGAGVQQELDALPCGELAALALAPDGLLGGRVGRSLAETLWTAGYDVWNWSDQALLRAVNWEYKVNNFPAQGDDAWQIYIVNRAYGTSFPTSSGSAGKNMDFTDWVFGR